MSIHEDVGNAGRLLGAIGDRCSIHERNCVVLETFHHIITTQSIYLLKIGSVPLSADANAIFTDAYDDDA